jgi:hypothetical protein
MLCQVGISKFCTGEPETVTLDLPGKGPVAKVYATLTFRPTEALHDSAADIERDAFGFEIVPLQRDTYRAHKDVLHKLSKDDTMRIEELLETGLHINRQQVFSAASVCVRLFDWNEILLLLAVYVLFIPSVTGLETCRNQGCAIGSSWRSLAGFKSTQRPLAARAGRVQVSCFLTPLTLHLTNLQRNCRSRVQSIASISQVSKIQCDSLPIFLLTTCLS